MLAPLLVSFLLCLGAGAPAAPGSAVVQEPPPTVDPPAPEPRAAGDDELRAAWRRLSAEAQREILEWVQAELAFEGSFQQTLLRHVLGSQDRAPAAWPLDTEPPLYDPAVHAPAQPIARKRLDAQSARAKQLRSRVFARVPAREVRSAWRYDYGTRELRRGADVEDLDRRFENLLKGLPADQDLVEALVERLLDDGAQQPALRAFGHAYSDRAGAVAPGITLYDAWCSGIQMEMPDVECLGLVHDVLDDWTTWRAPVPAAQHDALYAKLGAVFQDAHRHRGLRHALARAYVTAEPVQRDGYGAHAERLQVVWDVYGSDPARLGAELPPPDEWRAWLEGWIERCKADPTLAERGRVRARALAADRARARATLARVMHLAGALED